MISGLIAKADIVLKTLSKRTFSSLRGSSILKTKSLFFILKACVFLKNFYF